VLDDTDSESVGTARWFLMSRVQSAIAEKSTPLLLHASLWNSFIERRINFQQHSQYKDSSFYKTYNLYKDINERMEYWSNYYNGLSNDAIHNKKLVIQQINKEFYNNQKNISGIDYQFLLIITTDFDPQEWDIYTNGGFYLLIPKNYSTQHSPVGFRTDSLKKITDPEDSSYIYLESRTKKSFVDCLPDFFLTFDDFEDNAMPYAWNIIAAGHGGYHYTEKNDNGIITWSGEPIINNLTLHEFKGTLEFFHSHVKTHLFEYSTCYGAGNHSLLLFNNDHTAGYNFAIICDTLTDCTAYCKWETQLPSDEKAFLTPSDIIHDEAKKCWQFPLRPVYYWEKFFNDVSTIDFSINSIEHLQEIMGSITYSAIANIPVLCLPNTTTFFPLQSSDIIKVDDELLKLAETNDESITLNAVRTVLLESNCILPTITLNHYEPLRIVSIKPDDALHYIKKLEAYYSIDLPSAFWQAQYQRYDKTFIIDECTFPARYNFQDIASQTKKLTLKNVIITQQKFQYMRILFTIDEVAMMIIAHKISEEHDYAIVQEIITMTPAAQEKYKEYYESLKKTALGETVNSHY